MKDLPISRRTVLKGLGVSMALPLLDAMLPKLAFGQQTAAQAFPRRMAFCYVPNGVLPSAWNPVGQGTSYTLGATMQPLAQYRQDILILSGLTCDKARPNGDGTGDHARAQAAFLTGKQARKSATDIRCGISADQYVAERVGARTRFPSLEIGCEGGRLAGFCDPGYSCAYTQNLSWRGESTPAPKEVNPRAVFDRLFAGPNGADVNSVRLRREQYNQSILDFVMEDARSLNNQLGTTDQRRMDEYMSAIRDVERRIRAFPAVRPTLARSPDIRAAGPGFGPGGGGFGGGGPGGGGPGGAPAPDYRVHLRAMADLLAVAFQTDVTRISTFVFSNELSNRNYRIIDVPEGHHDVSHHMFDREKMAKVAKINLFHMEQFAYLVGRLKAMPEGAGSVLDNCMILYGSGNGDGARHNHEDLPILIAGKCGGSITTGRHVRYPRNTPLCNLYLQMMERMGVQATSFGDSNGRLPNLV